MNVIDVMEDGSLLGQNFRRRLFRADSWRNWKVFLRVLFGLRLDQEAKEIFARHTGRPDVPAQPFTEAFAIVGRRGGKSVVAGLVATYLAAFKNYDDVLAPGEVGTLMVIAADRRQARVIFKYITAFFQLPMLSSMVVSQLKESIELSNRTKIEIHTCSFKATRGYTLIGVIADELAFWSSEDSANPDVEVLNALRPGLATTNGLLLGISSPYAKKGALYCAYRENYGKNESSVLVWKASSREMNATLPRSVVASAYARDAASAKAEFGGEFRDDVSAFVSVELIERVVVPGRRELPPVSGVDYCAFADASGGSSDSYALAVGHAEGSKLVLDLLRERPAPFNPEEVTAEFAAELKRFHVSTVVGDRYAGLWPSEQFSKRGISYTVAELNRSELYLEMLPLLTSSAVELLDHANLKSQLANLERRTARSGKDSIDHPPGQHDDCANVCAGVLAEVARGGAVLGLIEYFRKIERGEIPEPGYVATRSEAACLRPEVCPPCPACRAQCTTVLQGNNEYRCQQCGHQFPRTPEGEVPKPVLPSRSNLEQFRGARAQMNPPGFRTAFARFLRGRNR